jgi:hypothetical protein
VFAGAGGAGLRYSRGWVRVDGGLPEGKSARAAMSAGTGPRGRHVVAAGPACASLFFALRIGIRCAGAGDWLSGRAPRSHRGGHWFDPSIAHVSSCTSATRSRFSSPRTCGFVSVSESQAGAYPSSSGSGGRGAARVQVRPSATPAKVYQKTARSRPASRRMTGRARPITGFRSGFRRP